MMDSVKVIVLLFSINLIIGQDLPVAELIDKSKLDLNTLVRIDSYGTIYSLDEDTFIKTINSEDLYFSSIQLGTISSANVFNPLKINLFYENFNTVILLDNRMAEISRINFNDLIPFRLVTKVSAGFDNSIWIYNQNTQQLELFDFLSLKTKVKSLPISGEVIAITSNFNFCYVLTDEALLAYNYLGNLVSKIKLNGFSALCQFNENLLLRKENQLFFKGLNSNEIQRLELPELLINQFFVTDETLYIYDGEILHRFHLKLR